MKSVAQYYDKNSRWFGLWERASGPVPVHRRVWAPGVRSGRAALDYVHSAVAAVVGEREAASVIDLGCGSGALLSFLHNYTDIPHLVGVTASRVQASQVRRWMSARDPAAARWEVRVGDFLEPGRIRTDHRPRIFTAIESMVHAPSANTFLRAVANAAEPGDELFVCDDFLAESMRRSGLVDRFRQGWRVPAVTTVANLLVAAEANGWQFVAEEDWTRWVHRPSRDVARLFGLASVALHGLSRFPFVGNLSGGAALRAGYGLGFFSYRALRLRKIDA